MAERKRTKQTKQRCEFSDYFKRFFARETEPVNFEHPVKAVLATFAVFTGFALSGYIKETLHLSEFAGWFGWTDWFRDWHFWAFFALMALLLRYIIGSAIHLNFMYVPVKRDNQKPKSRSRSMFFLFKDFVFLVIFGLIAMSVSSAANKNIDLFMQRAILFVGAGFVWSVLDAILRAVWGRWYPNENPGHFWILWALLDLIQFTFTLLLMQCPADPAVRAGILALFYVIFLYLDVKAAVRAVQIGSTGPIP